MRKKSSDSEGAPLLRSLADAVPVLLAYVDADEVYRYVNEAYFRWFGLKPGEIVGRSLADILGPAVYRRLQPYLEAVRTGQRVSFEDELPYSRGGSRYVIVDYIPHREGEGSACGHFAVIRDISSRRQVEEALIKSEATHRLIGETIPFGSWAADAEGRCTYVAKPFLAKVGLTLEEARDFGWLERLEGKEAARVAEEWMRCVKTGKDWRFEYRFRGEDGEWYDNLAVGRPVRDLNGRITSWVGFNLDITERKRREKELARSHGNLQRLVRERTDELERGNLRLRKMAVELSLARHRERLRIARILHDELQQTIVAARFKAEAAEDAGAFGDIAALLKKASAQTRSIARDLDTPRLREEDLEGTVRSLARWMKEHFELKVLLDLEADLAVVKASPSETAVLRDSCRELLFNVVKHAGVEEARVRIFVDAEGNLHLTVDDHGAGSDMDPLRARLSRADGLGLMGVRNRLEALGGSLGIETSARGGFRVEIILPRVGR